MTLFTTVLPQQCIKTKRGGGGHALSESDKTEEFCSAQGLLGTADSFLQFFPASSVCHSIPVFSLFSWLHFSLL